ncbi:TetR/AcrR family transcriptional regulator [Phytomonospora sp. NPDC050363]|uniref:TetR/AcrR family transcriptional regulator n=1 Tax=Phytomonospora sp. NPDC050363 TaxID=3155642 RepID=UPI0033E39720
MSTRAEQREQTRRALLTEGRRRFAADGYGAVVFDDVAKAVGVTKGAAYHHFGSKLGLFTAVVRQAQEDLGERVAAAADAVADPWESFLAGCRAFLTAGADPGIRRIVLVDAPVVLGWNEWREIDDSSSARHLGEALCGLMTDGVIASRPLTPLTRLLSGAMNEAAVGLAREPAEYGLDETVAALEGLLRGLRIP